MHKKKRGKWSFSKTIVTLDIVMAVSITIASVIYQIVTQSYNIPLITLVDTWIAQMAIIINAYYKKEGKANNNKYAQDWFERMASNPDVPPDRMEAIGRVLDSILRSD